MNEHYKWCDIVYPNLGTGNNYGYNFGTCPKDSNSLSTYSSLISCFRVCEYSKYVCMLPDTKKNQKVIFTKMH